MRLIDAENFEAFDSTLPIQIAPKGMRARKIASFFYAEGCKRVLESIDAASTQKNRGSPCTPLCDGKPKALSFPKLPDI